MKITPCGGARRIAMETAAVRRPWAVRRWPGAFL
jgi:hypothetical protein